MGNIHWQSIESYQILVQAAQEFTFERALGTVFFVSGTLSRETHDVFARRHHQGQHLLKTALGYDAHALALFEEWTEEHEDFTELIDNMRNYILENRDTASDLLAGITWYRRSNYYVNTINRISERVREKARKSIKVDMRSHSNTIGINTVIIVVTTFILIPIMLQMARKTSKTLSGYTQVMDKKSLEVKKEKKKTENILNQMLPKAVSDKYVLYTVGTGGGLGLMCSISSL